MGADLYSAGLLVQHELSGSVAVPHREERAKLAKVYILKRENSIESVPSESVDGNTVAVNQNHHHHHHHHQSQSEIKLAKEIGTDYNFKREIVWFNAIGFLVLHCCGLYGVYLMVSGHAKIWTSIYCKSLRNS